MRLPQRLLILSLLIAALPASSQVNDVPETVFKRANENAAVGRWDDAVSDYAALSRRGLRSPSLYWNWSQAAGASGRKGEALWALLRTQELAPGDANVARDIDRLRAELGLDPSEISLGFWGEVRRTARRFRFDAIALGLILVSIAATMAAQPRRLLSLAALVSGLVLLSPYFATAWRETRGVVVQKDAPLLDAARSDAIALANLREGEVVPLLGDEGEHVRIQDASGARGFAHKSDVRTLEANSP
jgi:hypothetical protein